ncbi:leucine--tRNA ligase [Candidatus Kuenenbacteria bacterium]|nr:leucine--tRNA ligase [Candidatus Kuenenbacteria bacterium]
MEKYNPQEIEPKWQKIWDEQKIFEVAEITDKKKFFGLIEFPYPSGDGLHTGHLRSNTAMDIICRKRRMQGYNVLYPIGFDAFGLPTENYAIKKKIKPQEATEKNIATFTKQLKEAGFSFDWGRSFSTTDEDYYKWTQWIFVQMFKAGLAEKKKETINWCTSCKIGLANEEVVNGVCERCGGEVIKKVKEQWVLKITKYADRLIEDLDKVDYLERIKMQQINWIGKSEGATVKFPISKIQDTNKSQITNTNNQYYLEVFTTRPDTLFGATFMVVAPEHSLIQNYESGIMNYGEVKEYVEQAKKKSDLERTDLNKEKTGVELKGIKAINPVNAKEIPIFVADYVMMGYGTGAIMAVPAHDERDYEFAKKYNLEIVEVIKGGDVSKEAFAEIESGEMVNSEFLNGLKPNEAIEKMIEWLEEPRHHEGAGHESIGKRQIQYKLHDWIFSRQRYWGEPIPMVYCEKCGWQTVPEKDLPVVLPNIDDYLPTDEGDSPLAKKEEWVKTNCPVCGGEAKRETDVMPNWAGSNWYFIRYTDPKNDKMMVDPKKAKYWLPVDWYNGGMEHTTLHLLYSRFVWKFLYDICAVPKECGVEPYAKRTAHGMILGEGGVKMSKSRGNVINPDEYVKKYGADTLRVYEMFMGPFDLPIAWEDKSVNGVYRFLNRVWNLQTKLKSQNSKVKIESQNPKLTTLLHQTIKKVGDDIEEMKFNTAVAQMMILLNELEKQEEISVAYYSLFIILLLPFAPHLAEELWQTLGHKESIMKEKWPEYDPNLIKAEKFELVVQVNGKVRERILVPVQISETEVRDLVMKNEKVVKWLESKEPKKMIYIKGKLLSIVV